jgi:hypothetical protein
MNIWCFCDVKILYGNELNDRVGLLRVWFGDAARRNVPPLLESTFVVCLRRVWDWFTSESQKQQAGAGGLFMLLFLENQAQPM